MARRRTLTAMAAIHCLVAGTSTPADLPPADLLTPNYWALPIRYVSVQRLTGGLPTASGSVTADVFGVNVTDGINRQRE
jgi:hypothetical protein